MKKYQKIGILLWIVIVCCMPQTLSGETRILKWAKECWSQLLPSTQRQNAASHEQEHNRNQIREIPLNTDRSQKSEQEQTTSFQSLFQKLPDLSNLYAQSQILLTEALQRFSPIPGIYPRYRAATLLVAKLFGPSFRDPLAEDLRRALLNDPETRRVIKPLERHVNRLFYQIENHISHQAEIVEENRVKDIVHSQVNIEDANKNPEDLITPLHRYLIRILVSVVWRHRAGDHVFVQEAMSLIERVNAPHSIIRAIGVFEQAILYVRRRERYGNSQEMKKAIDIALGQDSHIRTVLRNSYRIEPSFEQVGFNQEVQLILYVHIHLGQRINQIARNLHFQPTNQSVQDLQRRLRSISPFLSEIPNILNGFQFLEEVVPTSSEDLISLFESESKGALESLFDHINTILQIRPLTHIERVFVLELIKAMALGGVQHPFVSDSIEKFVDWPIDEEQSDFEKIWDNSVYSTILHRIAVLQQTHRYYQDILHGQADYTQLLDMVLNMGTEVEAASNPRVIRIPFGAARGL